MLFAAIAPLGEMMGNSRDYYPRYARYPTIVRPPLYPAREIGQSPLFPNRSRLRRNGQVRAAAIFCHSAFLGNKSASAETLRPGTRCYRAIDHRIMRRAMKQLAIVIMAMLAAFSAGRVGAQSADLTKLECEVLESSGPPTSSTKPLAAIRYVIVRHKNSDDRERLSAWLQTHSGAEVAFAAADGRPHRGVLRRLRMCFGRGLLIFAEPVDLKERETIVIEFSPRRQTQP